MLRTCCHYSVFRVYIIFIFRIKEKWFEPGKTLTEVFFTFLDDGKQYQACEPLLYALQFDRNGALVSPVY